MAWLLDLDRRSISAYESGESVPRADILEKIARETGFPIEFFYGDDLEEPNGPTFRSMARMSARLRDMALSQGAIANLVSSFIEKKFHLPMVDIPDISHESDPESASEILRNYWGLGAQPINNMIHLLESKGVRVFSLAIDAREIDAFSMWKTDIPMVFLNTYKTSEHSRMDAAHELAHLVLHRRGSRTGKDAEKDARAFASAFLIPKSSVKAKSKVSPSYAELVELKTIWKVSVAALNYRLHDLGMTTDWYYRMTCIEITRRGRTIEPNQIERETSQILPKVFSTLYEENVSRSDVARQLAIPREELENLMFGLTFTAIDGGQKGMPQKSRANLKLITKN